MRWRARSSGNSTVFCTIATGLAITAGSVAAVTNANAVPVNTTAGRVPSLLRTIAASTGIASHAVGFIAQARPSAAAAGTTRSG